MGMHFGGLGTATSQGSHFAGHDGEAAALFAGSGSFHDGVQGRPGLTRIN